MKHCYCPLTFNCQQCDHGASGNGSTSAASNGLDLAARIRFVAKAIEAVPTMAPATPQPIATARPDDEDRA